MLSGDGTQISWQAQYFLHLGVCLPDTVGSWLKGLDVVEHAARGARSTLEMVHRFHGRCSICCIWVCVCIARATFGGCLKGLDVDERAARGSFCVTGAALLPTLRRVIARVYCA